MDEVVLVSLVVVVVVTLAGYLVYQRFEVDTAAGPFRLKIKGSGGNAKSGGQGAQRDEGKPSEVSVAMTGSAAGQVAVGEGNTQIRGVAPDAVSPGRARGRAVAPPPEERTVRVDVTDSPGSQTAVGDRNVQIRTGPAEADAEDAEDRSGTSG